MILRATASLPFSGAASSLACPAAWSALCSRASGRGEFISRPHPRPASKPSTSAQRTSLAMIGPPSRKHAEAAGPVRRASRVEQLPLGGGDALPRLAGRLGGAQLVEELRPH